MVVLKKIKGSTLMETLVATVLIVVVFMLASMILNNLFSSSIKGDTRDVEAVLNELEYRYINNKVQVPYKADFNKWHISIDSYGDGSKTVVEFRAIQAGTTKTITKQHFGKNQ